MHCRHFVLMTALSNPGCAVNQSRWCLLKEKNSRIDSAFLPHRQLLIHTNSCWSLSSTPCSAPPLKPSKLQSLIMPAADSLLSLILQQAEFLGLFLESFPLSIPSYRPLGLTIFHTDFPRTISTTHLFVFR